jgi:hypothetical protein
MPVILGSKLLGILTETIGEWVAIQKADKSLSELLFALPNLLSARLTRGLSVISNSIGAGVKSPSVHHRSRKLVQWCGECLAVIAKLRDLRALCCPPF